MSTAHSVHEIRQGWKRGKIAEAYVIKGYSRKTFTRGLTEDTKGNQSSGIRWLGSVMHMHMHAVHIWLPHAQVIHTKSVAKSLEKLLQRRELRLEEQVKELQQQKAIQNVRVNVSLYSSCTYIIPTTAEFRWVGGQLQSSCRLPARKQQHCLCNSEGIL